MRKYSMLFIKSKKVFFPVLISITLLITGLYFYSASGKFASQTILINTGQNSLIRFFSDDDKPARWWSTYQKTKQDSIINIIQFQHYYLGNKISVKIKIENDLFKTEMQIIPASENTSYLRWQFDQPLNKDPLKRIAGIFKRHLIEKRIRSILFSVKEYTEKSENIYGYLIQKTKVKDTLLAVTRSILSDYPTMPYVYDQVNLLRQYISRQRAIGTNFPMLYVYKTDRGLFETNIALPISKPLINDQAIVMERMVAGDILWTECKGGPSVISRSFKEMENYMQDHQHSSPALPFELLIVDRLKEPDTTKWITGVYYPIY